MGAANPNPKPGLLFFGLLAGSAERLDEACDRLGREYGKIIRRSEVIPFSHSTYYEREMGSGLLRQWALSEKLIGQDEIVDIKLRTNTIEDELRPTGAGGRSVNIDPGYVTTAKVVLATTKDCSHRLYVGRGIYAEVTLAYRSAKQGFQPWPWTYPDHREAAAFGFFNAARGEYLKRLKKQGD